MKRGQRRRDIMDLCPKDFEGELESFIDEVEREVLDIVDELTINDISEIAKLEDAYGLADNLADSLCQHTL